MFNTGSKDDSKWIMIHEWLKIHSKIYKSGGYFSEKGQKALDFHTRCSQKDKAPGFHLLKVHYITAQQNF
jgi:hypothetical protein